VADASYIAGRVQMARARCSDRDTNHRRIIAMRKGKYEEVAPGLFNTAEFDQPLVANLIDTTARDVAEVMAPLPAVNCQSASLSNASDQDRQDKRSGIANSFVQVSRLQDQMYGGADRYNSFGFLAYMVEPDFEMQTPVIRVGTNHSAYYAKDYRGRVKEYFEVYQCSVQTLCAEYPEHKEHLLNKFAGRTHTDTEVVRWHDDKRDVVLLLQDDYVLYEAKNLIGKCLVRVVERPDITGDSPRGQFDDVIWVQIARALIQTYTMNAIERSVNAPIVLPKDVQEIELGPFSAIQTDNPQGIGPVPLNITPGLFPEASALQQEQLMGSRYPEGRSGSFDASIITGQGVQALMGTFNTQVSTFQRLNASALEEVIALCFEMDEKFWGDVQKTVRIKDNGAPRQITYTPSKDIKGDYVVDVAYGAIAGLDPNRGLIFVLQSMAGGLISKSTGRRSLGGVLDLNIPAEERQMQLEQMDDSIAAALAQLPLAIPQMALGGADPRELVLQVTKARDLVSKGKSPSDAVREVFAPKEAPPQDPMAAAMQQAQGPGGAPPEPGSASSMLMMLAGQSPSGSPNLQANVSRMIPTQ
jgi:hypothetical protein